jgi:hypothetical protein
MSSRVAVLLAAFSGVLFFADGAMAGPGYKAEIQEWRDRRETRLKADDGWLTVAGLYWLKEGAHPFGAGAAADFVLPEGSAPPQAGTFRFSSGRTTVTFAPGVQATINGAPPAGPETELRPDDPGPPDIVVLGDLTMLVIKRGERYGIRLRDKNSRLRREFTTLHWYPVRESYRVAARWEPYDPPRAIAIPDVLGQSQDLPCPGAAVFEMNGRTLRLEPVIEVPGDVELFFIFRDMTSGKETYGAGRFFYADPPKDGTIVLDFNKAYNPPCAFTPFATCPLPPPQNRLDVAIKAGEKKYGEH